MILGRLDGLHIYLPSSLLSRQQTASAVESGGRATIKGESRQRTRVITKYNCCKYTSVANTIVANTDTHTANTNTQTNYFLDNCRQHIDNRSWLKKFNCKQRIENKTMSTNTNFNVTRSFWAKKAWARRKKCNFVVNELWKQWKESAAAPFHYLSPRTFAAWSMLTHWTRHFPPMDLMDPDALAGNGSNAIWRDWRDPLTDH